VATRRDEKSAAALINRGLDFKSSVVLTTLHIELQLDFRIASFQISDGPFSVVSTPLIARVGHFSVLVFQNFELYQIHIHLLLSKTDDEVGSEESIES